MSIDRTAFSWTDRTIDRHDVAGFSWTAWDADPVLLAGLLVLTGAYLYGIERMRQPGEPAVRPSQVLSFLLGVVGIFLTLQSPLHVLSEEYLLSAHMVQHLLLTMIAVPLLLLGAPAALLRPILRWPLVLTLGRWLTMPLVAFVLFNSIFGLSHLPALYDLTLHLHALHVSEHLIYLAAAVLLWWPVLSPLPELPRLSYPLQLLYLFLNVIPGSAVGAWITLSPELLYPTYAVAPRVFDLSPRGDQVLGGLIMWVGGGLIYLIAFTIVFFVWAGRDAERADWVGADASEGDAGQTLGNV